MNIVEQRYDFLVDVRSLEQLDGVMLKRLLFKLYRHKGWLFNYLYYKIDYTKFNASQIAILEECAVHFYGKSLMGGVIPLELDKALGQNPTRDEYFSMLENGAQDVRDGKYRAHNLLEI